MAPVEPGVSEEWLAGTSKARNIFATLLATARASKEIAKSVDPDRDAIKVQIIINGIASLVIQDEKAWPPKRQLETLRAMLTASFGYNNA